MKITCQLYLFIFFLLPVLMNADENKYRIGQQAESWWAAHDDEAAIKLYEQALSLEPPLWQESRIFYNLGTIKLSQHQFTESILFFQKVNPDDLSFPRFGRHLFFNEGINYLKYTQNNSQADPFFLTPYLLYIEQSQKSFKQAQELDCQIQITEESQKECQSYLFINQWLKASQIQKNLFYQQQNQKWIEQAQTQTLLCFLFIYFSEFSEKLNLFTDQKEKNLNKNSIKLFLQQQLQSFQSVWNVLNQRSFSPDQKTKWSEINNLYLKTTSSFLKNSLAINLKNIQQITANLSSLIPEENHPLQQAYISYSLLMLQDALTANKLQHSLDLFSKLNTEQKIVEGIKKYLELSLEYTQEKNLLQAHFFLLAGFSQVKTLIEKKPLSSIEVLTAGLAQTSQTLQLFLITQLIEKSFFNERKNQEILRVQTKQILQDVSSFVTVALDEQENHYQHEHPSFNCQLSPWDQVIPLFDQGLKSAQKANEQLNSIEIHFQSITAHLQQTIEKWQQALNLIMQNHQNSSNVSRSSSSQQLTETFRLIQEMYLQDQSSPPLPIKELHSW